MPWFEPVPSARNGHEGSKEADLIRERIANAVQEGDLAFWEKIATAFPEVKHGDFTPEATIAWRQAMDEAVYWWLIFNHPKSELIRAMREQQR